MDVSLHMTRPQYLRQEVTVRIDGREHWVVLTEQQAEILLVVLLNHPRPVQREQIIEFVWSNPDLEPEWSDTIVMRQAYEMNRRLKHLGLVTWRNGGGYQIGNINDHRRHKSRNHGTMQAARTGV